MSAEHTTHKRATWRCVWVRLCLKLLVVLTLGLLVACGSAQEPPKPAEDTLPPPTPADSPEQIKWGFMSNAIEVLIVARADINIINDENHAVMLRLVQVATQEGLREVASTQEGLVELLEGKPEKAGILLSKRLYVQPGSVTRLELDRAEGARYFAVVAGFDLLEPDACLAITPFPIHQEKITEWLVLSKEQHSPGELDAKIFLSDQRVQMKGFERVRQ